MTKAHLDAASPLLRGFFGFMEAGRGKSARTVDGYFYDLQSFFRYYKRANGYTDSSADLKDIDILDVDIDMCRKVTITDVNEFLLFAASDNEDNKKNGAAALSRKCSALRCFFKYLATDIDESIRLAADPLENLKNPKLPRSLPRFLSLDQSIELLQSVDGENKERDYCILTLFLNCGMRLSELVGIDYNDILSNNRLRIHGKGNKERIIYLNAACVEAINTYKAVRPLDGNVDKRALFVSKRGSRISPKTVQWLVKKHLGSIGMDACGYSVHKLRHTAATLMYQEGDVDIRVLQDILGHENLGTTQIYTHVSSEQMQNAANANPLARLKSKDDTNKS